MNGSSGLSRRTGRSHNGSFHLRCNAQSWHLLGMPLTLTILADHLGANSGEALKLMTFPPVTCFASRNAAQAAIMSRRRASMSAR